MLNFLAILLQITLPYDFICGDFHSLVLVESLRTSTDLESCFVADDKRDTQ